MVLSANRSKRLRPSMEKLLSANTESRFQENDAPVAWRPNDWRRKVPMARSTFYEECKAGRIKTVKRGASTLVTTSPKAYIAALSGAAA